MVEPYFSVREEDLVNTWTIAPSPQWLEDNQKWLRAANLPDTPQCDATLTGVQCELVSGHPLVGHMITSFPTTESLEAPEE